MKPHKILPEVTNKVVVRSTNWVGDTVTMLPFLVTLRKAFLDEQITVSLIVGFLQSWRPSGSG